MKGKFMPANYIKSLSDKYNVSVGDLEKDWNAAKNSVNKSNSSYWPTVVSVFKKIIKSHYGINENYISFIDYKNLTEEFEDQVVIPTKEVQKKNIEDKYGDSVKGTIE